MGMGAGMAAGSWRRKLADYISTHMQRVETAD